MATEPNKSFLQDEMVPTVTLNGQKWPIPKLAPKQNEVVVPLVLELVPDLMDAIDFVEVDGVKKQRMNMVRLSRTLSPKGMHDLYTIAFTALTRAHKELLREEFDEWPLGTMETVEAVIVIAKQTGLLREKKPGEVVPSGEA
jgi:hypothetical protein